MAETTMFPFSCGSQAADWQASNCESCRRIPADGPVPAGCCELLDAINVAWWGDGRVSLPVAERMGAVRYKGRYGWPCPEHQPSFVNVRPDGTVDPNLKPPPRP